MPVFSVVIPAYNREKYIARAIESVLAQTYQDFEIIVVDDHSADQTADAVSRMMQDCKCLRLYRQTGDVHGAQAARNRGIREAKGAWIAFLDSDDTWTPDHLEVMAGTLQLFDWDPYVAVYSDYVENHVAAGWTRNVVLRDLPTYDDLLVHAGPTFPGLAASRAALEEVGGLDDDVPSYQEWDTALTLARVCRLIHIKKPLFVYDLHEDATISKDGGRDVDGLVYHYQKFHADILERCGVQALQAAEAQILARCAYLGERERFFQYYQSFRTGDFWEGERAWEGRIRAFTESADDIYIYGAGSTGMLLKKYLEAKGMTVADYVISAHQQQEEEIGGVRVLCESALPAHGSLAVFVATLQKSQADIVTVLSAHGNCRAFLVTDDFRMHMEAYLNFAHGDERFGRDQEDPA